MSKESRKRHLQKGLYFSFLGETALAVDPYVKEKILSSFPLQPAIRARLLERYRFGRPQLRPALVRMAYELVGGQDWEKIIPACASVEVRDTAYYCYDDVADLALSPKLFLLANSLVTISDQMMAETNNQKALSELFKLDENNISAGFIEFENVNDEEHYFKKVVGFNFWENAFRIGAIFGLANEETADLLGEIGKNIGMAYIVANDTWDFGKSLEDFSSGKYTLPIIWAQKNTIEYDKVILESLFGKNINEQQKDKVREIMVTSGAIVYGQKVAWDFCKKAINLLDSFPQSPNKQLIEFSMTMTQRNKYYSSLDKFKK